MINEKYYNDIKKFPEQFKLGFDSTKNVKVDGQFDRVVVCGMGGSSLYVELVNDYLATFSPFRLDVNRGYDLKGNDNEKTLYIVASYSGNTEEVLEVLNQIKTKKYSYIILTAGGKLLEDAHTNNIPHYMIPKGLQPRLSTGYFIGGILQVLHNMNFIEDKSTEVIGIAEKLIPNLDEESAKELASKIHGKVPVIYSTSENSSIARVSKIKFNENAKTQSFWNFFPELNHNEMVGFQDIIMNPLFLIFRTKFTNVRNSKRIDIFVRIMNEKNVPCQIVEMSGDSILEEILSAYFLVDHITYYLAEIKKIDPEPVDMVEQFKELLEK